MCGFSRARSSRRTPARSLIRCGLPPSSRSTTSTRAPSTTRAPSFAGCCKPCSGKEGFRRGLDLYFERHDGQAVTVEDFISALGDANKTDLSDFLLWYNQAGTPASRRAHDLFAGRQIGASHSEPVLSAIPDGAKRKPVPIPVKLGLLGGDGEDLPLNENGKPLPGRPGHAPEEEGSLHLRRCRRASRAVRAARLLRAR